MELKTSYASDNYPIIVKHHAINSLERYIKNEEQRFFIIDKQVYNLFVDKLEALAQKFDGLLLQLYLEEYHLFKYRQLF